MTPSAHIGLPKYVRDRDIVHDRDGRVFVALGHIQPSDRILSFLKYIPDPEGEWRSGNNRYRRVFWGGVDSVTKGMAMVPPDYVVDDAHFGTSLLEPPRESISKYFSPELRLSEIFREGPSDELESAAKHLAEVLHDALGIPLERIGVTGSICWKAHDPARSDINMNVYGYREAWRLQYGYEELTEQNRHVTLRSYSDWGPTLSRMMERFPQVPSGVVENLFLRRSELCIDGKCIGIMPVLRPNEVPIRHGSEHYASMTDDPVNITMDIHDVRYGIFMPAVYEGISEPVDAIRGARVSRMMVYDGVFRGLLRTGDRVETVGTLQRVRSGPEADDGNEFYQIMVGTKNGYGREFIHVVKASA